MNASHQTVKIDLHCHSHASSTPPLWVMQMLNCPESFTRPQLVRQVADQRGMNFITLTDHDTTAGYQEIAHYDNVLIGCEVTTFFPDGVAAHVLCYGFTEHQFYEINRVRHNIYEFVHFLHQEEIVHICAHPLHKVNGRTTWDHFEKMILLFKHFETVNGSRLHKVNAITEMVLRHLTEETIEELAYIHGIEPLDPEAWIKHFTGGSDDHSGLYIGSSYTEVEVEEYSIPGLLQGIRRGKTRPCGHSSGSFTLAHMCGSIAYQYWKHRTGGSSTELFQTLGKLLDPEHPTPPRRLPSIHQKIQQTKEYFFRNKKPAHHLYFSLKEKIHHNPSLEYLLKHPLSNRDDFNHHLSELTSDALDAMIVTVMQKPSCIPNVLTYAPLLLSSYVAGSKNLYDEEDLIARANDVLGREIQPKVAWFTDSFSNMDGVSKTCKAFLRSARKRGLNLTLITSTPDDLSDHEGVKNFAPVHSFKLPGYEKVEQHLPSFIRMMKYLEAQDFNAFVISTPGPVGWMGLLFSKLFQIPVHGIYHTDLPRIAMQISNDPFYAQAALMLTKAFYNQTRTVFAPCKWYARDVENLGIPEKRIQILERWVDNNLFSPQKRDADYWEHSEPVKLLYVGRISKDKNPELLLKTYQTLAPRHDHFVLHVVGDGPYFQEMEERTRHWSRFHMTGAKYGLDLAKAYASSDLFIYPGLLDTFGNVVIEAQASGLPCIVMNEGGPPELILNGQTGFVARSEGEFIQQTELLIQQRVKRQWLSSRAVEYAATRFSEPVIFEAFWKLVTDKKAGQSDSPKTVFDFNSSSAKVVSLQT